MAKKSAKKKKRLVKKKRTAKKRSVKKKRVLRKKSTRKQKKKKGRVPSKGPELPEEPVGRVTHYFPKVRAAAIMIEREGIRVGDVLYFKGHTTRFKQSVESLQINHQTVVQAGPGDEIGVRVKSRTREHDLVFKL
jgi:hypothetical protein